MEKKNYDHLAKARISRYVKDLEAAGVPVPILEGMGLVEQERVAKEAYQKAKGEGLIVTKPVVKAPKKEIPSGPSQTATNSEPNIETLNVKSLGSDERVKALELEVENYKRDKNELNAKVDALIEGLKKEMPSGIDVMQDPKVLAVLRSVGQERDGKGYIRDGYTNPSDRLEKPVTFFANKSGIYIQSRKEAGMTIGLPDGVNGPITFKRLWRYGVNDEKGGRVMVRYVLTTDNNRLVEFLKKCDGFGRDFFISETEALRGSYEKEWSDSYRQSFTMMKNRPDHTVLQMAHEYKIPVSAQDDPNKWRDMLAQKMADDDLVARNVTKIEIMRDNAAKIAMETAGAVMT